MIRIALRNVLRQKMRTAMTLAAIVCGVAGLILGSGWVKDIFLQLGEALIHSQSGHLQVFKSGFYAAGSRSPEKFLIPEPERFKQSIEGFDGVEDVSARLYFRVCSTMDAAMSLSLPKVWSRTRKRSSAVPWSS